MKRKFEPKTEVKICFRLPNVPSIPYTGLVKSTEAEAVDEFEGETACVLNIRT